MRNTLRTIFPKPYVAYALVLMFAGSVGGFLTACDGGTHLKGVVLSSDDSPLAEADVKLITGDLKREVKSSASGVFKIGMTHSPWNPELTLEVAKPGFKPFEKRFYAKEHLESIVATLEPVAEVQDALRSPFLALDRAGNRRYHNG